MDSATIRRRFTEFFQERGHTDVPSASLVPADDPTLLFTNAGMVQFKRTFLGQDQRPYRRAVSCQKCVRAGGKHNDLEQVGLTRRHHTFFEMLGNFSFGDYFKREAIEYAWEFVTGTEWLHLPPDRLRVTVHHEDEEARQLWHEVTGLPLDRIYGLGDADNFWQMGDTGPCGPCSEIFVDLEWSPGAPSVTHSREEFETLAEGGRFLEIWNLVFMQFDRSADGVLTPLPKPSVDTGAGLERIAAVMQGEDDNFHTDLFLPLLEEVSHLVGRPYPRSMAGEGASFRVLADHARAVTFLLADGVYPGNEGRGYVLRRILRRAVRHAWLLGRREATLAPLTAVVVKLLGDAYPEIAAKQTFIHDVVATEEQRFLDTIEGGLARLDDLIASGLTTIPGAEAFRLYDTFGFPVDLTQLIAGERGVDVDLDGFEEALEAQRSRSRSARTRAVGSPRRTSATSFATWIKRSRARQRFVGYTDVRADTDVLAHRQEEGRLEVVLHHNPFYLESGGQVSDTGVLEGDGWRLAVDRVLRTERGTAVSGPWSGDFEPTPVVAVVDEGRRRNIERNHSATHLVHRVLRARLGDHVRQQGSLVEADRLRFDFSHHEPVATEQLAEIEHEVNERIWANDSVVTREMPYPEALALGAMAFFADKYGDVVRVVQMGDSIELCGGTHVSSTGALGVFRFTSQGGVAAGVRRIEAVTGPRAWTLVQELDHRIAAAAELLRTRPEQVVPRLEHLLAERDRLAKRQADARREGAGPASLATLSISGIQIQHGATDLEDRAELGAVADRFRTGRTKGVLILLNRADRGAIHVAVTDDLVQRGWKAGDLVSRLAAISGGKGGGRPTFASAGAGDSAALAAVEEAIPDLVTEWLATP